MHDLRASAADLFLGARCAGCGTPATRLCRDCLVAIRPDPAAAWPQPIPPALRWPAPVLPVAAGVNAGVLRRVLVAWKESGATRLTTVLDHHLAAAVAMHDWSSRALALVPIPTSRRSRRARGCSLTEDLARSAARRLRSVGIDVTVVQALGHARQPVDQVGLGADARRSNLDGAFMVRSERGLVGRDIVIVDDILTTGVTVADAVRSLSEAGHRPVGVAVVAATARESETHR